MCLASRRIIFATSFKAEFISDVDGARESERSCPSRRQRVMRVVAFREFGDFFARAPRPVNAPNLKLEVIRAREYLTSD